MTIFALSSGAGRAGIAVIRISGPAAGDCLITLVRRDLPPPRKAVLRTILDPGDGRPLDHSLVIWSPGPRSFTGEDVVELHLHGGPAIVAQVLECLSRIAGLRPAEPGEFTHRAFDNGKMDLAQVEGLADLINAETEAQRRQAFSHFDGHFSRHIENWRDRMIALLAHHEAAIDFPDEDLPRGIQDSLRETILCLIDEISQYLVEGTHSERLRDGLQVAIVGPPNVGKSSLLNNLAARDVAIVSDFAGTTRDAIEVHLDLAGFPVTLVDTAGLRSLSDDAKRVDGGEIEIEGMRRSLARAAAADLKLVVFDGRSWPELDPESLALVDRDSLVIFNKEDLRSTDTCRAPGSIRDRPILSLSAMTGQGIGGFLEALEGEVRARFGGRSGVPLLARARHRAAIESCRDALARSLETELSELSAEDLRLAVRALGRITGRVDVEDLLDVVFRDFCIGK